MSPEKKLTPPPRNPQKVAEAFWEWWNSDAARNAPFQFHPVEAITYDLTSAYGLSQEEASGVVQRAEEEVIMGQRRFLRLGKKALWAATKPIRRR